jgi:hypothetical protein
MYKKQNIILKSVFNVITKLKMMRFILSNLALMIIGANADWKVVWEDNFDGKELNTSEWHFDGNPGCGKRFN